MTVVVDASVALKWVLQELETEQALLLWDCWQAADELVTAPPIFQSEVTNAVYQSVRPDRFSLYDAIELVNSLLLVVETREPQGLYTSALALV